jgi:hypothetical protein
MKTKIVVALMAILMAVHVWADEIDKLEELYLGKVTKLKTERDAKVKEIDDKYSKDTKSLAQSYINSLKKIEVSIVKKGDLDGALKVRSKIKEIENALTGDPSNVDVTTGTGPSDKEKELRYKLSSHPVGASKFNGHYYKFVEGPTSWTSARLAARKMGGYLATVTSKAEFDFVVKISSPDAGKCVMVGGMISDDHEIHWITKEKGAPSKEFVPRFYSRHIGPFLTIYKHEGKLTMGGVRGNGLNSKKESVVKGFVVEWDK